MEWILDRFENGSAVLERDGACVTVPAALLPPEAKEGDVVTVMVDHGKTDQRKKEIEELCKDLWT